MIYFVHKDSKDSMTKFIEYIGSVYGVIPAPIDIDWGNGSPMDDVYAGFYISDDILVDVMKCRDAIGLFLYKQPSTCFFIETPEYATVSKVKNTITNMLDSKAKEYGFDNIMDACSYVNSRIMDKKRQSLAFNEWRDVLLHESIDVINAQIETQQLLLDDVISSLPTFESILDTI